MNNWSYRHLTVYVIFVSRWSIHICYTFDENEDLCQINLWFADPKSSYHKISVSMCQSKDDDFLSLHFSPLQTSNIWVGANIQFYNLILHLSISLVSWSSISSKIPNVASLVKTRIIILKDGKHIFACLLEMAIEIINEF